MAKIFLPNALFFTACVVTLFICWPGLHGPLVLDDIPNLNQENLETFGDYREFVFGNDSGPSGRSVSMATFAFNYLLSGSLLPFELKLTNLLIHLIIGILVYFLCRNLLARSNSFNSSSLLAAAVATLWLVHPLNTGLVFYAIQRMAQLSCLFVLLGLLAYARMRLGRQTTLKNSLLFATVAVCCVLGFYSKENAILLPLLILVTETYFIRQPAEATYLKFSIGVLSLCGIGLAFALLSMGMLDYSSRPFGVYERLITQPIAILDYVKQLLLTLRVDVGVFQDDYPIAKTFLNYKSILSTVAIGGTVIYCLVGKMSSQSRFIWGGFMFFLCGHALESTVFPLEMYFEHRNYLPSFGIFLALVCGLSMISTRTSAARVLASLFLILAIGCSIYFSHQKAKAWSSYPNIVVNAYTNHPKSKRASMAMTDLLVGSKQFDAALQINRIAHEANPRDRLTLAAQRFYVLCKADKKPNALDFEMLGGRIDPLNYIELSTALDNLYAAEASQSCPSIRFDQLSREIAMVLDIELDNNSLNAAQAWSVDYYLIDYFRRRGETEIAQQRLSRLVSLGSLKASYYQEDFKL